MGGDGEGEGEVCTLVDTIAERLCIGIGSCILGCDLFVSDDNCDVLESTFLSETFRRKSVVLLVLLAGADPTGRKLDVRGG